MANIIIVTESLSHSAYNRTQALISNLGHSVTGVESASVTLSTLMQYDLIVCVRSTTVLAHSEVIKEAFNAGIPLLLGGVQGLPLDQSSSNSAITTCGFGGFVNTRERGIFYAIKTDPILIDAGVTNIPTSIAPYTSPDFAFGIRKMDITTSAVIIVQDSSVNDEVFMAYAKRGDLDIHGNPFPANIMFCGFLYGGQVEYTYVGTEIVRNAIEAVLKSVDYIIEGTVKDENDNPLVRTIRAYRRSDGNKVTEIKSDVGGNYKIYMSDEDYYTLVCLDLNDNTKNAVIQDNVKGVLL